MLIVRRADDQPMGVYGSIAQGFCHPIRSARVGGSRGEEVTTADPTPTVYNSGDTNPECPMPALSLSPFAARLTDARLAIPVGQDMLAAGLPANL